MQSSIRKRMYAHRAVAVLATTLAAVGISTAQAQGPTSQMHGDWEVVCVQREAARQCRISQIQAEGETGQRLLAVELQRAEGNGVRGALVLPFGLALPSGVRLSLDQNPTQDFGPRRQFSTCLPDGCVVPLQFDAAAVQQLRAGTTLNLHVVGANDRQPVQFRVSLKGLTAALAALPQ